MLHICYIKVTYVTKQKSRLRKRKLCDISVTLKMMFSYLRNDNAKNNIKM